MTPTSHAKIISLLASCMVDGKSPSGQRCTDTDCKALRATFSLLEITVYVDSVMIGLLYMAYPDGCQHEVTFLPKLRIHP